MSAPSPSFEQRAREWMERCVGYRPGTTELDSLAALLESVARERDALNEDERRRLVERAVRAGIETYDDDSPDDYDATVYDIAQRVIAAHDAEREART